MGKKKVSGFDSSRRFLFFLSNSKRASFSVLCLFTFSQGREFFSLEIFSDGCIDALGLLLRLVLVYKK